MFVISDIFVFPLSSQRLNFALINKYILACIVRVVTTTKSVFLIIFARKESN